MAGAAESLAKDAASCARRLARECAPVQFIFAGSVLLKQPRFAGLVARELKRHWQQAIVWPLRKESVYGALALARLHFPPPGSAPVPSTPSVPTGVERLELTPRKPASLDSVESIALSPTEQRHPLSMNLDKLSVGQAIKLMLREDQKIPAAVLAERKKIERAVNRIVRIRPITLRHRRRVGRVPHDRCVVLPVDHDKRSHVREVTSSSIRVVYFSNASVSVENWMIRSCPWNGYLRQTSTCVPSISIRL